MKTISLLYIAILTTCWPSYANEPLPSVSTLKSWFDKPYALAPWEYKVENSQYRLVAQSATLGGSHLWYRPAGKPCIVSVLHQFFDQYTFPIGTAIYANLCQVMVSNSHHRYSDKIDEQTMDLSKRASSLHHNAILAYQASYPEAKILQIHGFSKKKRSTLTGKNADFIVSQGKYSTEKIQQLSVCLRQISSASYDYPRQINELGGTKNVMHQLALTPDTFFHIEISRTMRQQLIEHNHLMEQLTLCLRYVL
ncbi:hypothetical protein HG263_18140 [Pseudoalteromonas sp. JBTF-M23]|uniref:Uncharacterized protein n=1 Tax=Pseudoalteromonas caenipelagi TaxID=2726988 RepID=A0A849VLH1_9GAMM|nr:hypothetical protein [Pseudoalteromonas caenipelagi]NOU52447.1 hypothetical protein [Pseudoalteromonas caenipelagi]